MVNETLCCLLCFQIVLWPFLKEYLYTFTQRSGNFVYATDHIAVALHRL